MPINNGVFCNQIPLPWEKKKKASLWIQLTGFALSLGFPHSDAAADCFCTKGHIYMLLISPRCSAMTQTVIKGTCPGTVMWPFHLYCRILSVSVGCFLIELTVGGAFLVTTKLQQRLTMLWGFVWHHCQSPSHTTRKQASIFICKYVLDGVLDRCACVSHYLKYLTHDVLKLLKKVVL